MRAVPEAIDDATFQRLMAPLGPFERRPHLAVAVSGGADSLALAVLTATWIARHGGRATALTVDHGWRRAAAAEALWVAMTMRRLGFDHRTLRLDGRARPTQAAARAARYTALDAACRDLGCLHLLVAHHADDLGRTIAMRRRRGAGPGLAGMPAVRELDHCRLLRPLLAVPAARLRATAGQLGHGWLEDPTNRDPRHERTLTAPLAVDGSAASAREAVERADARWLARHGQVSSDQGLSLDGAAWLALDHLTAARIVSAAAAAVGRPVYAPSMSRSAAVALRLRRGDIRQTLAHAVIGWHGRRLTLCPEPRTRPYVNERALADAPFAAPRVVSDRLSLIC